MKAGEIMLLLNKTLLRMAKGLWGWIFLITALKLLTLVGTAAFAQIISGFLGDLVSPQMTAAAAGQAVLSELLTDAGYNIEVAGAGGGAPHRRGGVPLHR